MGSFSTFLNEKKNEIKLAIISFILGTIIIGTILSIGQDFLKGIFLSNETSAELILLDTSIAVFNSNKSYEILQLLEYELSASDFIKNIKVSVIFNNKTEIIKNNILYSIDIEGFDITVINKNHIEIYLKHHLDKTRKVRIYLLTQRIFINRDELKPELPEIHIEGKDKNEKTVYQ